MKCFFCYIVIVAGVVMAIGTTGGQEAGTATEGLGGKNEHGLRRSEQQQQ